MTKVLPLPQHENISAARGPACPLLPRKRIWKGHWACAYVYKVVKGMCISPCTAAPELVRSFRKIGEHVSLCAFLSAGHSASALYCIKEKAPLGWRVSQWDTVAEQRRRTRSTDSGSVPFSNWYLVELTDTRVIQWQPLTKIFLVHLKCSIQKHLSRQVKTAINCCLIYTAYSIISLKFKQENPPFARAPALLPFST